MSYSILKKPVALAGMDPIACLSRGGMPMPTPVPWGGVDVDCQLPGEPPQAAQCRSVGGMWYRELGLCIPGTIPGGIPSFPATPYAPAPPANQYDQVAAQVCTATGGRYANGICNYPQLGVTRTRSQLVDSEYEPPAGWTPPAGGCPQGQVGWPPVCVPVPNTLPAIPTTPAACPAGTVWDAASGKCIAPAQLPPPGESESEKQVAPAAPAEEKKLPSWVIPAVAGGAAFVILAALVMRQPREMRANREEPWSFSPEEMDRFFVTNALESCAKLRASAKDSWRRGDVEQAAKDLKEAVSFATEASRKKNISGSLRQKSVDDLHVSMAMLRVVQDELRKRRSGRSMMANAGAPSARLSRLLERARRASLVAHRPPPGLSKEQLAELHSRAGLAHSEAATQAWGEGLADIARRHDAAWERHGKRSAELRRAHADRGHSGPYGMRPNCTMRQNPPVELSYADLNVFQRYWWGQWDPLYAVLSRRGNSVSWVTVDASEEELERLTDVANEITEKSDDKGEVRTAKAFLKRQK